MSAIFALPLLGEAAGDWPAAAWKCDVQELHALCGSAPGMEGLINALLRTSLLFLATFWLVLIAPIFWAVFLVKWIGEDAQA